MKNFEKYKKYTYQILDSTNEEAKRKIYNGEENLFCVQANEQTNGKGRMGRTFYSPKDTGLYFTIGYPVKEDLQTSVHITTAASVCVMQAIREICKKQVEIKWVNDLYYQGKKVCGILAESTMNQDNERYIVLGIGLNISTEDFPKDLETKAGSLNIEETIKEKLLDEILDRLYGFIQNPRKMSYIEEYRTYSMVIGKEISYMMDGQTKIGKALDIDENGGLLVRNADGTNITLSTGEISINLM